MGCCETRRARDWKKLHLGVDRSGVIVAHPLTEATVDDATTAVELIHTFDGCVASVTGDAAYDSIAFYDAAAARGASVVVPPTKAARVSRRRPRSTARDRTIQRMKKIGRRRWKRESSYHREARVENAFFRYKSIIGSGVRARTPKDKRSKHSSGARQQWSVKGSAKWLEVFLFMHQRRAPSGVTRWIPVQSIHTVDIVTFDETERAVAGAAQPTTRVYRWIDERTFEGVTRVNGQ